MARGEMANRRRGIARLTVNTILLQYVIILLHVYMYM